MPLHDHFRPPLSNKRHWESFQATWVVTIARDLNGRLPERFIADPRVRSRGKVEIDLETGGPADATPDQRGRLDRWMMTRRSVVVRDLERDGRVAAVIELVQPADKARPENRITFAGTEVGRLYGGLGVMVVDAVTVPAANLHDEVMRLVGCDAPIFDATVYAASYAPVLADDTLVFDIWARPLAIGQPLPTLPLQILGLGRVQVDLDATYREACEWSRTPD